METVNYRGPAPAEGELRAHRNRPLPLASDIQPVQNETADRIITGLITLIPFLMLFVAGWQMWNWALRPSDLIVFGILYVTTGLGVTVGFHRLFTHRSFATSGWLRGVFGALGSAAIEGPLISWVADHRKHHACSDREGDPHSPHHGHGNGLRGALKGFYHAHMGWLFIHTERGNKDRFAPDLQRDPVSSFIDRTFFLWAVAGFLAAFALGWANQRRAARRPDRDALGRGGADVLPPSRHLQHQLALPPVRSPAL